MPSSSGRRTNPGGCLCDASSWRATRSRTRRTSAWRGGSGGWRRKGARSRSLPRTSTRSMRRRGAAPSSRCMGAWTGPGARTGAPHHRGARAGRAAGPVTAGPGPGAARPVVLRLFAQARAVDPRAWLSPPWGHESKGPYSQARDGLRARRNVPGRRPGGGAQARVDGWARTGRLVGPTMKKGDDPSLRRPVPGAQSTFRWPAERAFTLVAVRSGMCSARLRSRGCQCINPSRLHHASSPARFSVEGDVQSHVARW